VALFTFPILRHVIDCIAAATRSFHVYLWFPWDQPASDAFEEVDARPLVGAAARWGVAAARPPRSLTLRCR